MKLAATPQEIKDPEDKKPSDWVDDSMMDDPEDKKPENWVTGCAFAMIYPLSLSPFRSFSFTIFLSQNLPKNGSQTPSQHVTFA